MKTLIKLAIMLIITSSHAQFSLNTGIDPKTLLFGTDNQYTTHNSVLNIHFKVEYHGRENDIYFAIGFEYANLQEEYRAWFADFGKPINFNLFNVPFIFIPQVEIGNIFREHVVVYNYDSIKWDDTYYYGVNIPIRYLITDWLGVELEGSIDRATDLPDRDWRYGGKINLIFNL